MEEAQTSTFWGEATRILEHIGDYYGPSCFKDCSTIMMMTPIIGTIMGIITLIRDAIYGRKKDDLSKYQFTVNIIITVIITLGLGFLLFLVGCLVTLGRALKNACSGT